MARIPFVRHRTVNQIVNKYRACRHLVEKVRWHAVWLLARTDEPRPPAQVADLIGLSDVTVRRVLHRWNVDGPAGLIEQCQSNGCDSGVHVLPPCTPELQPVEPFWALVREGVANDTFDRLGQLRRVIRRRCRRLAADTATVFGAVGFRWAANLEA